MNANEIVEAVKSYLDEERDEYALMITGEWGSGKTYFVEHDLTEALEGGDGKHSVIVASAYGVKDVAELCGAIEAGFLSKYAIGKVDGDEESRKDFLVKIAKDTGVSFLGKKIRDLEKKVGVDFQIAPFNAINLLIGPQTLLVIDDVERCPMPSRELLGAVNRLVTSCGKKVLLVCNENEWRKLRDNSGEDDASCDRLLEKTVWRRCRFEPSIDDIVSEVLGDDLGGIYPEATQDASSVMGGVGMSNFRSLCKIRPVLAAMKESGFFREISDRETAREIFKDVCNLATRAARGEHFDPPSDDKNFTTDTWMKSAEYSKYATLAFIPRYFEKYEGINPDKVRSDLEEYLASYYPEDSDARKASKCLDKIKFFLFYNRDIPKLMEALIKGIGSRGLSFDRYPEVLRTVSEISDYFDLSDSYSELVEKMRAAIQERPEAAVASIAKHSADWQAVPFDPSEKFKIRMVDEINELRRLALETRHRHECDSLSAHLEDDADKFADDLYQAFSREGNRLDSIRALIVIDAGLFADALRRMSPDRLAKINNVLPQMEPCFISLDEDEQNVFCRWIKELADEVAGPGAVEYYQKRYFKAIAYNLNEILVTLPF